jgi:lipopolysaccharide transport system ATP-binding protein
MSMMIKMLKNQSVSNCSKILTLDSVGLYYNRRKGFLKRSRFWALEDVTFDLYAGETLGIIGKNGVGKSTLLRVLAGIVAPNKGRVFVHRPGLKISLLSLGAGFMPLLSGRENAILNGIMLGATQAEMLSRMNNIEAFSELGRFFDEPVNTYSNGMRARLAFSVANQIDPDVILMDEVMGVGDEAFRKKSTKVMKERIKSEKTVVMVSHNVPLIRETCNRLIWIENGKTQAEGNVHKVLDEYLESFGRLKKCQG